MHHQILKLLLLYQDIKQCIFFELNDLRGKFFMSYLKEGNSYKALRFNKIKLCAFRKTCLFFPALSCRLKGVPRPLNLHSLAQIPHTTRLKMIENFSAKRQKQCTIIYTKFMVHLQFFLEHSCVSYNIKKLEPGMRKVLGRNVRIVIAPRMLRICINCLSKLQVLCLPNFVYSGGWVLRKYSDSKVKTKFCNRDPY